MENPQTQPRPRGDHHPSNDAELPKRSAIHETALLPSNHTQPESASQYLERGLPQQIANFIDIPAGEFNRCREFILNNKTILDSDDRVFFETAFRANRNQNHVLEQQCLQRLLLVRNCRERGPEGQDSYLTYLVDTGMDPIFVSEYDRLQSEMLNTLQSLPAANKSQSTAYNEGRTDAGSAYGFRYERPFNPGGPGFTTSHPQQFGNPVDALLSDLSNMRATPWPATSSAPNHCQDSSPAGEEAILDGDGGKSPGIPGSEIFRQQPGGRRKTPARRSNDGRRQAMGPNLHPVGEDENTQAGRFPTIGGQQNADFRGGKQTKSWDPERLDPSYQLRRDPMLFFVGGKVFMMLWHENYTSNKEPGPKELEWVTTGPKGERIYTKVLRMIVFQQNHGYCWCVPILSYGKHGVACKDMKQVNVEKHAIAYSAQDQSPPSALPGEEGMTKPAIAIDMKGGQRLDSTSRIHFGKVHTVEWNVKVKEVGQVAAQSMGLFEAYVKAEMIGSPGAEEALVRKV